MRYLDIDLEIGPGIGRTYPLVVHSDAGTTRTDMQFPYDDLALKDTLKDLRIALLQSSQTQRALTDEEQAVQTFGQRLFGALFAGMAGSLFYESRAKAIQEGLLGVRVRLNVRAADLAGLPWEYLYDPRQQEYLCLSSTTPVVRYPELAQPMHPLQVTPPLRILGMIASPSDQDALDIKREKARMDEALADLKGRGQVELTWLSGQTWEDLQEAMWRGPWHIFHFIGHGGYNKRANEGVLALCDEDNQTHLLSARDLARLLASHRTLRLVVLNACEGAKGGGHDLFSSTAATLAQRGIPAVLAMQEAITDKAAIQLTRTLYRALAHGLPVDAAVAEARTAISVRLHHSLEWGTPVLFMRAPDSVLFTLDAVSSVSQAKRAELEVMSRSDPEQPAAPLPPVKFQDHQAAGEETPRTTGRPPGAWEHGETALPQGSSTIQHVQKGPAQQQAVGQVLLTLKGGIDKFSRLAWSPDSRRLASTSPDNTIHLWDAGTGQLLAMLPRYHTLMVYQIVWSPDGRRLASASADNTARIWDAISGQLLVTLMGHTSYVMNVAWSPDGRRLASASNDGNVILWDAASGKVLAPLIGHSNTVNDVAWSPDGRRIASAGLDQTVRLWDCVTAQLHATLTGHMNLVSTVAWSPDGRCLASTDLDANGRLWDAVSCKLLTTLAGNNYVGGVAWSPDCRRLASANPDHTISLWDASSGQLLVTMKGHNERVHQIAWSSDGCRLASISEQTARLWDTSSGQSLATLAGYANRVNRVVAWSPDGYRIAARDDNTISVYWTGER